mmetsp:Transcript_26248/g.48981  ORF Transcript_26248/g.48981 Transcript_26248/m.48981 type:complete len:210 (+) Transcript_26248:123-752(+)
MKINTKKCVPIPGAPEEAIIHRNKYLQDHYNDDSQHLHAEFFHSTPQKNKKGGTSGSVNNHNHNNYNYNLLTPDTTSTKKSKHTHSLSEPHNMGRQVKYMPTLVYTPVSTSSRHHDNNNNNSPSRRLLSLEEMDDLNQQMANLFVQDHDDDDDDDTTSNASNHSNQENIVMTTHGGEQETRILGRVSKTVMNYKTSQSSNVLRSARFDA